MANKDNYRLLVEKLDQFIRKYYVNQLIRGGLYSIALILVLFLGMNFLEHYFYFSSGTRKVLFYSFLGLSGLALAYWVLVPMLHYFRLGKIISHEQSAEIIGEHFQDVKDKLLNILQLKRQSDQAAQKELILASINQKTEDIKLVPFQSAINLTQNRRYLRYAVPPLLLLLIVLFAAPSIIKDSTTRLINNDREFERPAPFSFKIPSEDLTVVQFEDYPLTVEVEGEQLPEEVFIDVDDTRYRLTKEAPNRFTHRFSNVQRETDFKLFSSGVVSRNYTLDVLKKPNILGFEVELDYPAYTQRKDEKLSSIGDVVVPQGTRIDWVFNVQNTDEIAIRFSSLQELIQAKRFSEEMFTYQKQALRDESYKLYISNADLPRADSISYTISVIPDLYPQISAEKFQDSLDNKLLFFVGEASDDYGLLNLSFNYRIKKNNKAQGELQTVRLDAPSGKQTQFDHTFDIRELDLKPGDEVIYYFEIFDNDAVNGSKSSRTNLMTFSMPTVEEYRKMSEENDQKIKSDLQKSLEESRKIQEDMKKMRDKLLQEKEMDWQSRKELEKLLQRQKELEKQIEQAKESFEENLKNQEEFSETDQNIMEKQEQLQKLFDEVMSEEMQKLMEQIEKLLQELEKEDALQMMEDFQFNDEEMEKELDRLLELFKQLELEQEMQEAIEKLEELAEEQEKLSEETEKLDEEEKPADESRQEDASQEDSEQEDSEKEQGQQDSEQNQQGEEKQDNEQNQQGAEKQDSESQDQEQQQQQGEQQDQNAQDQEKSLEEKQQEINEKFQEIQEQMEQIQQKNEELESPRQLDDQQQEMQDIQQDLNNIQQQLQQQQNKKASQSQKNAAQKMQQMAQSMAMQMQSQEMEQMQEDMQALRQLLENLVGLSFDQEDLIDEISQANINTPRYVDLVQRQFKLEDDFRLVEDSLQALSKRVFQIESFITEKVTEIKGNMRESLDDLEERRKLQASDHQQRTMKNVNDLALMLSEVMNQMQQQMATMMAGKQMCANPGQQQPNQDGRQPQDKISQGQQELNEQMKRMKEALERGKGISSKEFAEMAAKQAALRKKLREQQQKLREQGQGDQELQELIDQMDRVETELVNKQLSNEMLKRQQEILTRLLEHENAERQRKFDEQRKAESAAEKERKMPPSLEEYIKKRKAEIEMYKTVSPSLKPYYKSLVEEYFKSLQSPPQ